MGAAGAKTATATVEESQKALNESFKRLGLSDKVATIAANGRAS
jgi:hypothetical protein